MHFTYSPYQAFDNNPVFWADPSGANAQWVSGMTTDQLIAQWKAQWAAIDNGADALSVWGGYDNSEDEDCPKCDNQDILLDFMKAAGEG